MKLHRRLISTRRRANDVIRMMHGDCRDLLPTLPDASVHCVVTSPPYWNLRDYGTAQWDGGDAECDHGEAYRKRRNEQRGGDCGDGGIRRSERDPQTGTCSCGARRVDRQIGLEASPDEFIAQMVEVFREVRRVLRPDGTCWLNMGDSYAHGKPGGGSVFDNGRTDGRASYEGDKARGRVTVSTLSAGLKPKDLLMMPARVALALQADGWWLRSAIVWAKPNPMPESVTDRPTSAYEMVYLLTRSPRYFYDADAVREEAEYGRRDTAGAWRGGAYVNQHAGQDNSIGTGLANSVTGKHPETGRNLRNVWTIATSPFPSAHFATYPPELVERCIKAGTSERGCCPVCGKQWVRQTEKGFSGVETRIATKRVPVDNAAVGTYLRQCREALGLLQKDVAAHFPSVTGGLTGCVANWELGLNTPMPEQWPKLKEALGLDDRFDEQIYGTVEVVVADNSAAPLRGVGVRTYAKAWNTETTTTGWSASCTCSAGAPVPATVLDPFAGAGTTCLVADRLQRNAIGIELNPDYVTMGTNRIVDDAPLFSSWPPAEDPADQRMRADARQRDLFMAAD